MAAFAGSSGSPLRGDFGAMVLLLCRRYDYTKFPLPKLCRKDGDINGMIEFSAAAISPRCFLHPLSETGEDVLKPLFSPGQAWGRATGKVPILRVLSLNGRPHSGAITGKNRGARCAGRFPGAVAGLHASMSATPLHVTGQGGDRPVEVSNASRPQRPASFERRHCAALADRPATSPGAIDEGGFHARHSQ